MFGSDILVAIVTWEKIPLKSTCVKEELVQLGDASRGFSRHANGQKVIVVDLVFYCIKHKYIIIQDR